MLFYPPIFVLIRFIVCLSTIQLSSMNIYCNLIYSYLVQKFSIPIKTVCKIAIR